MNTVRIGALELATPLMLSPMAGVTNPPFRQLCREQAEAGMTAAGVQSIQPSMPNTPKGTFATAGLWVCEMVTTRALIERRPKTMNMIQPDLRDPVRSIQLYGVSPRVTAEAIRILIEEEWADHIDLNFGCPAPKVTRRGGGSALPWKLDLFSEIIGASIEAARKASEKRDFEIPVTAKIRLGIDDTHETWKDAARIAEDSGVNALTLHARTTAQYYSGRAAWQAIGELVEMVDIPVFGNGDVFDVDDAREMIGSTGCAGVAIGRGAQGRPWIFYNLAAWMHGADVHAEPSLGEVSEIILRHGELATEHYKDEVKAMREMRGHIASYLRGFKLGGQVRDGFARISTLDDLRARLGELDVSQPYPKAADGRRGRAGAPKRPHLPEDWLFARTLTEKQRAKIASAEIDVSGG